MYINAWYSYVVTCIYNKVYILSKLSIKVVTWICTFCVYFMLNTYSKNIIKAVIFTG